MVGAVLAVAVVVGAIALVKSRWSQSLPPDVLARIEVARSGILMEQIRELVLFSLFSACCRCCFRSSSTTFGVAVASSCLRHWLDPERAVYGGIALALGLAVVGGRRAQTDGERRMVGFGRHCDGETV